MITVRFLLMLMTSFVIVSKGVCNPPSVLVKVVMDWSSFACVLIVFYKNVY